MASRTPYTFITTETSITCYLDGRGYTASSEHPNYNAITELVKNGRKNSKGESKLVALFDTAKAIRSYVGKTINISDSGVLTHNKITVDNVLTEKIIRMLAEGYDIDPMLNFLINLRSNPSFAAQQELMLFLEVNDMPITPDGHVLAYKSVRSNYKDAFSGTFDNSVGSICAMERGSVNDDRSTTCSAGLHFAAKKYAGTFHTSGHLMILKINPADVVSIPLDYKNMKGRCCRYEVIDEVPMAESGDDNFNTKVVYDDN